MSIREFLGRAAARAQISTGVITAIDAPPANNVFTVTIGGVAISVTGVTDVAATATALRAALNASTHPYFAAITWSGTAGNIIGTADVAGAWFLAALTKSGAGTGTVTDFSTSVIPTGPNDPANAENYSGATLPTTGDTLVFKDSNISVIGWDVSGWGTLALLRIEKSYTGRIGLDRRYFATSADGETVDTTVTEYRTCALTIRRSRTEIGDAQAGGTPGGSGRIILDGTGIVDDIHVFGTGSSVDIDRPAVRLLANHASTHLFIRGGSVGVAVDSPNEVAIIGNTQVSGNAKVTLGNGVTWINWKQTGGDNLVRAAADPNKITVYGGVLRTEGDFAVAIDAFGGRINANHEKTGDAAITALAVKGDAIVDFSGSRKARTVDALDYAGLAQVIYDKDVVTITAITRSYAGPAVLELADVA